MWNTLMYDFVAFAGGCCILIYNVIKDAQWYLVQEGDATMITIAASLPGHKPFSFTVLQGFLL